MGSHILIDYLSTISDLATIINQLKILYPSIPIVYDCPSDDSSVLKKLKNNGFSNVSTVLSGSVKKSLDVLEQSQIELQKGFKIRVPKECDKKGIFEIDSLAHMFDNSSIVKKIDKSYKANFDRYFYELSGKNQFFTIYDHQKKPISHICYKIYSEKTAHIIFTATHLNI